MRDLQKSNSDILKEQVKSLPDNEIDAVPQLQRVLSHPNTDSEVLQSVYEKVNQLPLSTDTKLLLNNKIFNHPSAASFTKKQIIQDEHSQLEAQPSNSGLLHSVLQKINNHPDETTDFLDKIIKNPQVFNSYSVVPQFLANTVKENIDNISGEYFENLYNDISKQIENVKDQTADTDKNTLEHLNTLKDIALHGLSATKKFNPADKDFNTKRVKILIENAHNLPNQYSYLDALSKQPTLQHLHLNTLYNYLSSVEVKDKEAHQKVMRNILTHHNADPVLLAKVVNDVKATNEALHALSNPNLPETTKKSVIKKMLVTKDTQSHQKMAEALASNPSVTPDEIRELYKKGYHNIVKNPNTPADLIVDFWDKKKHTDDLSVFKEVATSPHTNPSILKDIINKVRDLSPKQPHALDILNDVVNSPQANTEVIKHAALVAADIKPEFSASLLLKKLYDTEALGLLSQLVHNGSIRGSHIFSDKQNNLLLNNLYENPETQKQYLDLLNVLHKAYSSFTKPTSLDGLQDYLDTKSNLVDGFSKINQLTQKELGVASDEETKKQLNHLKQDLDTKILRHINDIFDSQSDLEKHADVSNSSTKKAIYNLLTNHYDKVKSRLVNLTDIDSYLEHDLQKPSLPAELVNDLYNTIKEKPEDESNLKLKNLLFSHPKLADEAFKELASQVLSQDYKPFVYDTLDKSQNTVLDKRAVFHENPETQQKMFETILSLNNDNAFNLIARSAKAPMHIWQEAISKLSPNDITQVIAHHPDIVQNKLPFDTIKNLIRSNDETGLALVNLFNKRTNNNDYYANIAHQLLNDEVQNIHDIEMSPKVFHELAHYHNRNREIYNIDKISDKLLSLDKPTNLNKLAHLYFMENGFFNEGIRNFLQAFENKGEDYASIGSYLLENALEDPFLQPNVKHYTETIKNQPEAKITLEDLGRFKNNSNLVNKLYQNGLLDAHNASQVNLEGSDTHKLVHLLSAYNASNTEDDKNTLKDAIKDTLSNIHPTEYLSLTPDLIKNFTPYLFTKQELEEGAIPIKLFSNLLENQPHLLDDFVENFVNKIGDENIKSTFQKKLIDHVLSSKVDDNKKETALRALIYSINPKDLKAKVNASDSLADRLMSWAISKQHLEFATAVFKAKPTKSNESHILRILNKLPALSELQKDALINRVLSTPTLSYNFLAKLLNKLDVPNLNYNEQRQALNQLTNHLDFDKDPEKANFVLNTIRSYTVDTSKPIATEAMNLIANLITQDKIPLHQQIELYTSLPDSLPITIDNPSPAFINQPEVVANSEKGFKLKFLMNNANHLDPDNLTTVIDRALNSQEPDIKDELPNLLYRAALNTRMDYNLRDRMLQLASASDDLATVISRLKTYANENNDNLLKYNTHILADEVSMRFDKFLKDISTKPDFESILLDEGISLLQNYAQLFENTGINDNINLPETKKESYYNAINHATQFVTRLLRLPIDEPLLQNVFSNFAKMLNNSISIPSKLVKTIFSVIDARHPKLGAVESLDNEKTLILSSLFKNGILEDEKDKDNWHDLIYSPSNVVFLPMMPKIDKWVAETTLGMEDVDSDIAELVPRIINRCTSDALSFLMDKGLIDRIFTNSQIPDEVKYNTFFNLFSKNISKQVPNIEYLGQFFKNKSVAHEFYNAALEHANLSPTVLDQLLDSPSVFGMTWNIKTLMSLSKNKNLTKEAVQKILSKTDAEQVLKELANNQFLSTDALKVVYDKVGNYIRNIPVGQNSAYHDLYYDLIRNPNLTKEQFDYLANQVPYSYYAPSGVTDPYGYVHPALLNPTWGLDYLHSLPNVLPTPNITIPRPITDFGHIPAPSFSYIAKTKKIPNVDEKKLIRNLEMPDYKITKTISQLREAMSLIPTSGIKWVEAKQKNPKFNQVDAIKSVFMAKGSNNLVYPEDFVKAIDNQYKQAQKQQYFITYGYWPIIVNRPRYFKYYGGGIDDTSRLNHELLINVNVSQQIKDTLSADPKLWNLYFNLAHNIIKFDNRGPRNKLWSHPILPFTMGVVRIDTSAGNKGWIVEDLQSDVAQKWKRNLRAIMQRADVIKLGQMSYTKDELEKYTQNISNLFKNIHDVLFEAVKQNAINHGVEKLYMYSPEVMATISIGDVPDREIYSKDDVSFYSRDYFPKWLIERYHDHPKSLGFKPIPYMETPFADPFFARIAEQKMGQVGDCWVYDLKSSK